MNSQYAITRNPTGMMIHKAMPVLKPKSDEIAIRPLFVGICGTDLQILRGFRSEQSTILGHEGVAEVYEVGSSVTNFTVGQKCTFNPTNKNNPHDILGHNSAGVWQQHMIVSHESLQRGMLIPLNVQIPLLYTPLIEPLAVSIYASQLLEQKCKPRTIVVIGGGTVGLLYALYARMNGCKNVILVHNSSSRLTWAIERQIVEPDKVLLATPDFPRHIQEMTQGQGADICVVCTTRPTASMSLRQAIEVVHEEGYIDLIGGFPDDCIIPELSNVSPNSVRSLNTCGHPQPGLVIPYKTTKGKLLWLTGHRGVSSAHLEEAMECIGKHPKYYSSVISHLFSLLTATKVLETLRVDSQHQFQGKECVKMVIDCTKVGEYTETF